MCGQQVALLRCCLSSHKLTEDACSIKMLNVLTKISTDLKYEDKSFPHRAFSFS